MRSPATAAARAGLTHPCHSVYLGYHTPAQVAVGSAFGAAFAVAWLLATNAVAGTLFPWIAATRLARAARVRDLTRVPDVVDAEYSIAVDKRE